jgi:hypothetical protein
MPPCAVRPATLLITVATLAACSSHPPVPGLRPIPIKASWAWNVFEPLLQPWAARERTFTDLGLDFHQPGLNIHETAFGKDELLVQGNPGGQVLVSADGGAGFVPLCPRPGPGRQGSGVGVLRDGTLLAATNKEQVITKTFIVAHTTIHRAEVTRSAGSGDGTTE